MPQVSTCVGLDVHKKSLSVAFANAEAGSPPVYCKKLPNDLPLVLRQLRELGAPGTVKVCYEAGPTGYRLYRELRAAGFDCVVIAAALTPKKPGDKVKTDRIDALRLAECLQNGQLKVIHVTTEEVEALRELLRAREDVKQFETNTKRQISALMLRHGHSWDQKSTWTKAHRQWISTRPFAHQPTIEARTLYLENLRRSEARLEQLEQPIHEVALKLPMRDL